MDSPTKRKASWKKKSSQNVSMKLGAKSKQMKDATKRKRSPLMEDKIDQSLFQMLGEVQKGFDFDHFIYGLHDEIVNKALDEIKAKRLADERIESFVESFCKAWLKLVKWRWMVMDNKGRTVRVVEAEPRPCPKDAWSSHSFAEPSRENVRSSLPPPWKYTTHPPLLVAKEEEVEKPIVERVRRTMPSSKGYTSRISACTRLPEVSVIKTKTKIENQDNQAYVRHLPAVQKTAFPERAPTKVFMGPQVPEKKRNVFKLHVSEVNLLDEEPPDGQL